MENNTTSDQEQKVIPITSLADFKRKLKVGQKIACILHSYRYPAQQGDPLPEPTTHARPIREISIVQSNCFAIKTVQTDKTVDSYCYYPKASECKIENNRLTIYDKDLRQGKGGCMMPGYPEYDSLPEIPIMTYWLVE